MTIAELIERAHKTAVEKGWWETDRGFPEQLALVHSEVSEALEEYRNHGLSKEAILRFGGSNLDADGRSVFKPEGIAAELADILIRVADSCGRYGIPLEQALAAKLAFNETRPHRHGNKTC